MSANNKNLEYGWSSWLRRGTKSFGSRNQQKNKQPRQGNDKETLVRFGITDQLQELVKGFTLDTFKKHQQDDGGVGEPENAPLVGNVRQDLTEWQVKHANLMLSNVKEISQLRYVLCPRHMKERQFWDIYFKLVKNHVQQYELLAARESRLNSLELEDSGSSRTASVCEVEMMDANNLHASISSSGA
ncbi:uncharacterized protein LOC116251431 isoform X2 [Nymphaea colorata]|uniref:uncharacterized protein LOC116251431 isoform X2 n=1 Tax=Nymphaea colorata TaxID=210225 RepID=UPI00129D384A|nr:uncharacterized protein LOC116251431 isoform X2 [Nymphaea colorata]